ncbi:MAG: hypothetical protein K0B02_03405 [DPANN group archaeon]|nr:hypothetical protein [DPANN group archaeon]
MQFNDIDNESVEPGIKNIKLNSYFSDDFVLYFLDSLGFDKQKDNYLNKLATDLIISVNQGEIKLNGKSFGDGTWTGTPEDYKILNDAFIENKYFSRYLTKEDFNKLSDTILEIHSEPTIPLKEILSDTKDLCKYGAYGLIDASIEILKSIQKIKKAPGFIAELYNSKKPISRHDSMLETSSEYKESFDALIESAFTDPSELLNLYFKDEETLKIAEDYFNAKDIRSEFKRKGLAVLFAGLTLNAVSGIGNSILGINNNPIVNLDSLDSNNKIGMDSYKLTVTDEGETLWGIPIGFSDDIVDASIQLIDSDGKPVNNFEGEPINYDISDFEDSDEGTILNLNLPPENYVLKGWVKDSEGGITFIDESLISKSIKEKVKPVVQESEPNVDTYDPELDNIFKDTPYIGGDFFTQFPLSSDFMVENVINGFKKRGFTDTSSLELSKIINSVSTSRFPKYFRPFDQKSVNITCNEYNNFDFDGFSVYTLPFNTVDEVNISKKIENVTSGIYAFKITAGTDLDWAILSENHIPLNLVQSNIKKSVSTGSSYLFSESITNPHMRDWSITTPEGVDIDKIYSDYKGLILLGDSSVSDYDFNLVVESFKNNGNSNTASSGDDSDIIIDEDGGGGIK